MKAVTLIQHWKQDKYPVISWYAVYHTPVKPWRPARVSASGPLTDNVGSGASHQHRMVLVFVTQDEGKGLSLSSRERWSLMRCEKLTRREICVEVSLAARISSGLPLDYSILGENVGIDRKQRNKERGGKGRSLSSAFTLATHTRAQKHCGRPGDNY